MNSSDYHTLFTDLDEAIAILGNHRTPEPDFIAAYDTLKQSRAMVAKALAQSTVLRIEPTQMAA